MENILSILLFLPLLASIGILLLPNKLVKYFKWLTLIVSGIGLGIALNLYIVFDKTNPDFQFIEQYNWISLVLGNLGILSINYTIGIDGISLPLLVLASIIQVIGAISSFEIGKKNEAKEKGYFALYLLLSSSILGCFLSLDFFLFFLFFEFMLLPMYFLIGIWGGKNREYASIKFFIYTLVGSIFILLIMITLFASVIDPIETAKGLGLINLKSDITPQIIGQIQTLLHKNQVPPDHLVHTLDFRFLSDQNNYIPDSILSGIQPHYIGGILTRNLAFILLFIGFAIKLPLVPFHTWLPDAHVEAPTAISVVLAGILLKIGGYGFIRIAYNFFPESAINFAIPIAILGLISIVWGAYNALAQTDLKRQIAFSSVSHMGFVVIGLAALNEVGLNGAIYQMFSHGILSAILFLIVGVLYSRSGSREISNFQGLASKMPNLTAFTAIGFFASLGLPAFSGFIGEFFSLMGAFNSTFIPKWISISATLGIVLGAAYFLYTFRRIYLGKYWSVAEAKYMHDLTIREKIMLSILSILTIVIGIQPGIVFEITTSAANQFIQLFK